MSTDVKSIIDKRLPLEIGDRCFYIKTHKYKILVYECVVIHISPKRTKLVIRDAENTELTFESRRQESSFYIKYDAYWDTPSSKLIEANEEILTETIRLFKTKIGDELAIEADRIATQLLKDGYYNLRYGILQYNKEELDELKYTIRDKISIRQPIVEYIRLEDAKRD